MLDAAARSVTRLYAALLVAEDASVRFQPLKGASDFGAISASLKEFPDTKLFLRFTEIAATKKREAEKGARSVWCWQMPASFFFFPRLPP
jgi:hypothetical protein